MYSGGAFLVCEQLPAVGMERLAAISEAVNALIGPDEVRRDFFSHERVVRTLYKAIKPDPAVLEFSERVACVGTIAAEIRSRLNPEQADISEVLSNIGKLLDDSIAGVEVRESGPPPLDLSRINFEALASQFRESKQKNLDLEALKAAVRARLDRLVERNRTRVDYSDQFAELIESYNAGSRSIEELFDALVKLSQDLGEEQQRHVREHLGEEELVIFDILTRPSPELSPAERDEVKKVARDLLIKVKSLLVTDWRKTTTARARMRLAIEDSLDAGLPDAYTPDVYGKKVAALFEHVYEVYPNRGEGVFGAA